MSAAGLAGWLAWVEVREFAKSGWIFPLAEHFAFHLKDSWRGWLVFPNPVWWFGMSK